MSWAMSRSVVSGPLPVDLLNTMHLHPVSSILTRNEKLWLVAGLLWLLTLLQLSEAPLAHWGSIDRCPWTIYGRWSARTKG